MKKGFTLIELLVVVAIIGLLASIVVVSLGSARKGGRDAKRLADLKQIQTAAELYFSNQPGAGSYPAWTGSCESITDILDPAPIDPINATPNVYVCHADVDSYCLSVNLEKSGLWTHLTQVGTKTGEGAVCTAP